MMSTDEARAIIRNVKNARTEAQALAAIGEAARFNKNKDTHERAWSHTPRRSKFLRSLTVLVNLIDQFKSLAAMQVTSPEDVEFCKQRVIELRTKLDTLVK